MHIPDGFLSAEVAAASAVVGAGAVAYGLRRAERDLDERRIPMLGVTGAFLFAAQMINFPVAGGTSGHVLGAALAAILVGPWLACLVLTVVVAMQALAFADGGITALGANVLNIGVVGALGTGLVLAISRRLIPQTRRGLLATGAAAAWLAVVGSALAASLELGLSGTVPLETVLPAMLGVHAVIGVGEAIVTVGALSAVLASRPDLIACSRVPPARAAPAVGGA